MKVPETPNSIEKLDLMRQLKAYADGQATWNRDGSLIGEHARKECENLYNCLIQVVDKIFAVLLDRVTAREMETFTMHDRVHGRKVAHLMWHILEPERKKHLTPAEIALLVCSAHLHDLGMGLSKKDRDARLDPASDLWARLELDDETRFAIDELRKQVGDDNLSESRRRRATRALFQAEEALLTQDTRARHATYERYTELLDELSRMHELAPEKIPDIKACLSFDGDSYREKLIDICASHNEDAEALVEADRKHSGRPRFPQEYPIGCCQADLHMVAAILRLADILDFDRERTPPALFYYLLPGPLAEPDNDSGREWGKHLAISNWHIEDNAVVFRGRCSSHIIHHAIVLFASEIEREILNTRSTFGALQEATWPCKLPTSVKVDIHEEGYRYLPYRFELDDNRVYSLLMGGAIYEDPMVAVRELVQNAVDACKLRDAITCLYEPQTQPRTNNRILIRYEEPTEVFKQPLLLVEDTGTGMDELILGRYFLKVGRSYYNSPEFNQTRFDLRKSGLDFAPVSEFGIGFLSSFLLARRVEVETAMSESPRGDTTKRTLQIDGPTRLIRLSEQRNEGADRFKGTRVTLHLSTGGRFDRNRPPKWEEVRKYLEHVCIDLPYSLNLEHVSTKEVIRSTISAQPLSIEMPPQLERTALRIPVVDDGESGLEGEIVLVNTYQASEVEKELVRTESASINVRDNSSSLIRGGFRVGSVPGLPASFVAPASFARLRLTWEAHRNRRYIKTNLARTNAADHDQIAQRVFREYLSYLLDNINCLPEGQLFHLSVGHPNWETAGWLEKYDALTLYRLAANGWHSILGPNMTAKAIDWEDGRGNPLPLRSFSDELHWVLLDLVLPRVSKLYMGPEARFSLAPPVSGWKTTLGDCRTYISSPVEWGLFAEFVGQIKHLLLYQYPGAEYLNMSHRDRLTSFAEEEIRLLKRALDELTLSLSHERRARLSGDQAALIRRLQATAGDLEIGSIHGNWRLDSLKIPENP